MTASLSQLQKTKITHYNLQYLHQGDEGEVMRDKKYLPVSHTHTQGDAEM